MPQPKFILSDAFELIENMESPVERRFIMYNKSMEESLLLNEPIFCFLKNFQQENTLDAVTDVFAELTKSTAAEVRPIVQSFWQQMADRNVLVPYTAKRGNKEFTEMNRLLSEGYLLDEFRIEKNLYVNVPCHVYLAEDALHHNKVVLKVLQFPTKISAKARAHDLKVFEREFRILRSIVHPHIAACLSFRKTYAVIEYVQGEELYFKIKEKKEPDLAKRWGWLRQIFEAVAYLHEKNILHCDIHYSNVLITAENVAKLIDFDMACYADAANPGTGGMRPFIPPERIDLNAFEFYKNVPNFQSEVHQLGVLSFFVVYGRVPFKETTWHATAQAICDTAPILADTDNFGNTVPKDVRTFLQKCLEKNPALRFASAGSMHLSSSLV